MNTDSRIIVAADGLTLKRSLELVSEIGDRVYAIKIHDLYDRLGPEVVQELREAGAWRVWVDCKLHDIPNTVQFRAKGIADSGADILTVHASGEIEMMMAAVEGGSPTKICAITILTSLNEEQTHLLHGQPSKAAVLYLARLAKLAGVHGIVCSPQEVGMLAKRPELKGLKFVVPGVRSAGKEAGDQKRIGTPAATIQAGAHYLVIGRQITEADDPRVAVEEIEEEIKQALQETEVA